MQDLYRKLHNQTSEDLEKPDLILVDGSTNQINATLEILESLNLNIFIAQ